MLPTSFETLADSEPELSHALHRLGEWVRQHPDWPFLDPRILSKDIRDVDPFELSLTLNELVSIGVFARVYKVVDPTGTFTEDEWEEIRRIPPRIRDGFNQSFSTDDGDIVPVFRPIH